MFWFSHVLVFGMESTDYRWISVISASIGNEVSGTKVGGRNNFMGEISAKFVNHMKHLLSKDYRILFVNVID